MINIKITGYATDVIELQSALQEMAEQLEEDIRLEQEGKRPVGLIYAGDEEYCHIFLERLTFSTDESPANKSLQGTPTAVPSSDDTARK